jgi:hypothetical protein
MWNKFENIGKRGLKIEDRQQLNLKIRRDKSSKSERKRKEMEIEAFSGYMPNYVITTVDHGSIYNYSNYQYTGDNLVWSNTENYINPHSDISDISSSTSFYLQNQTINSTQCEAVQEEAIIIDNNSRSKRGRKKGCGGKRTEKITRSKRSNSKHADSSPASPNVVKKRRLAANARERRRMDGLNVAFDR